MKSLEDQLKSLPKPYVVMSVGIPGSGKTTVLKVISKNASILRISPDEIREEISGSATDQSVNHEAWEITYSRAQEALQANKSVIVDATHAEAYRRPGNVKMYRSYGAQSVVAVVFSTPLDTAKQRNTNRDRVVPEHALVRMHESLRNEPPTVAEGFDKVINV